MTTVTFDYTGSTQSWTVPAGVTTITVDALGAGGGDEYAAGNVIPKGGRVQLTLPVTPGASLQVNVGGSGGTATGSTQGAAGWNGGAAGGVGAGGGGGASDVRTGAFALADRVVVAGGAGGNGGNWGGTGASAGGPGGGTTGAAGQAGSSGNAGGGGGTQSAGGSSSGGAAGLGVGGTGQNPGGVRSGGGGGGGYYGGGGGGGKNTPGTYGAGGGGGSSWTHASATDVSHTQGYQTGNGQVIFTYEAVTWIPQVVIM